MYRSWLGQHASRDDIRNLIRKDICLDYCPGNEQVFRPDTFPLNRYFAFLVLANIGFDNCDTRRVRLPVDGGCVSFIGDTGPKTYDHVVLRFGPRSGKSNGGVVDLIPDHWEENREIYADCRHMRDSEEIDLLATLHPAALGFFESEIKEIGTGNTTVNSDG